MLTISVDSKQVTKALGKISDKIKDPHGAFIGTKDLLQKETEAQFASEGSHLGTTWKKLKPASITSRLRYGYGAGPILTRTGKMRRSFKDKKISKVMLIFGSVGVGYFKYHQTGTRKMARRPMLVINGGLIKRIVDIFKKEIMPK